MADLALNADALSGFAGTIRGLMGDWSQFIYQAEVFPDDLCDALVDLGGGDRDCATNLHSYLNALASLADAAAAAAVAVDQQLARQASGSSAPGQGAAG